MEVEVCQGRWGFAKGGGGLPREVGVCQGRWGLPRKVGSAKGGGVCQVRWGLPREVGDSANGGGGLRASLFMALWSI